MILKALYDYYHRSDDLAPEGWEKKEIPFIILIDKEGTFIGLIDTHIDKKKCREYIVIKSKGRTSGGPAPNIMWDNAEYLLGLPKNISGKEDSQLWLDLGFYGGDTQNKHFSFIQKVNELAELYPDNEEFKAVSLFYERHQEHLLPDDPAWGQFIKKPTVNLSFQVKGAYGIVAENEDLIDYRQRLSSKQNGLDSQDLPVCLVTGMKAKSVVVTSSTPIRGSLATAKLVAFQTNSGYDSFGNSQGMNAPISVEAEAAYTEALHHMLSRNSKNRFVIGNRTFLFWASSTDEASKQVEEAMDLGFRLGGIEDDDNPDDGVHKLEQVLRAIYTGKMHNVDEDRFYVLGLAPNNARISIIYWREQSLRDFARSMLAHFDDMDIVTYGRFKVKPYKGLYRMLSSVSLYGKNENIQPRLPDAVIRAILDYRLPYPEALYQACLRRICAECKVDVVRAAIIKAYLNRKWRINTINNTKKLLTMLDRRNRNRGYLCGRLFAVLERCQEMGGTSTLGERYMNAASATPATVFPTLLNLSVHHAEKLDDAKKIFIEKEKGGIIDLFPEGRFPAHLDLMERGEFFVGYYQQRQDFFAGRNKQEEVQSERNNDKEDNNNF